MSSVFHLYRLFCLIFLFVLSIYLQGYPTSVTPDYFPFQVWDSLQVRLVAHKTNFLFINWS